MAIPIKNLPTISWKRKKNNLKTCFKLIRHFYHQRTGRKCQHHPSTEVGNPKQQDCVLGSDFASNHAWCDTEQSAAKWHGWYGERKFTFADKELMAVAENLWTRWRTPSEWYSKKKTSKVGWNAVKSQPTLENKKIFSPMVLITACGSTLYSLCAISHTRVSKNSSRIISRPWINCNAELSH